MAIQSAYRENDATLLGNDGGYTTVSAVDRHGLNVNTTLM
jgi:hypothetical protein